MQLDHELNFYHSPNTRSTGVRILLEELGAPYKLHALNMKAGQQREPEYLAVNPMGKVPAVKYGGALVTEQVALFIFLTDLFPEKGLAPVIGDPQRGSYLRWLAFYGSCFEPAVVDRAMKRDAGRPGMVPYGDYDTMMQTLTAQLKSGPYLLGERFTAADILWGTAFEWTTAFGIVAKTPEIEAYIERAKKRPAARAVKAADEALAASFEA